MQFAINLVPFFQILFASTIYVRV